MDQSCGAKPYGFVYLIRCRLDGNVYVGQTSQTVSKPWKLHCAASRKPTYRITRAIADYGPGAFDVVTARKAYSREEFLNAEYEAIIGHKGNHQEYEYNSAPVEMKGVRDGGGGGSRTRVRKSPPYKAYVCIRFSNFNGSLKNRQKRERA